MMTDQPMTPRRPRRRVRYRVRPLPVVLPLFTPISEDDEQCTVCGALNTRECDSFTSFGGCTDWWERCTACGRCVSGCELSAVR